MARTLYVTDLDGTLLDPQGQLRPYSRRVLRAARERHVLVTAATARSWTSTRKLVGAAFELPIVVHGGSAVVRPPRGEVLARLVLHPADVDAVLDACWHLGAGPLVHTLRHGVERTSWLPDASSLHVAAFWKDRGDDGRSAPVQTWSQLPRRDVLGVAILADGELIARLRRALASRASARIAVRQDTYRTGPVWLEVTAAGASKGASVRALAQSLAADRIVAFGDDVNDLSLFEAADEAYAVADAAEPIRRAATAVIGSNADEAVARWLACALSIA